MELYKRPGQPSWQVDMVHPVTGERVRRSLKFIGSKVEAQKRAIALAAKLQQEGNEAAGGRRGITVREAVEKYLAALEAKKQPGARNTKTLHARLCGIGAAFEGRYRIPETKLLHDLTTADLETLSLERFKEGLSAQSVAHEIALIRAASRYVATLGYRGAERVLANTVKNPWRVPKVASKTRYLSQAEFQRVYEQLSPAKNKKLQQPQDLLVALAHTGGRWSEVAGLTWAQVDLQARTIRLWGNKTGKERVLPISDLLLAVLERRLEAHEKALEGRQPGDPPIPDLVFPGRGFRHLGPHLASISRAMTAAGLNDPTSVARYGRATPHSLRHTFASWLLQSDEADLSDVNYALGHSGMTMTLRYAHLSKATTLGRINAALNGVNSRHTDGT